MSRVRTARSSSSFAKRTSKPSLKLTLGGGCSILVCRRAFTVLPLAVLAWCTCGPSEPLLWDEKVGSFIFGEGEDDADVVTCGTGIAAWEVVEIADSERSLLCCPTEPLSLGVHVVLE